MSGMPMTYRRGNRTARLPARTTRATAVRPRTDGVDTDKIRATIADDGRHFEEY